MPGRPPWWQHSRHGFPDLRAGRRGRPLGARRRQLRPGVLDGLTQSQIAGDLTSPASPLTQAVLASANQISAAICSVDHNDPPGVPQPRRDRSGPAAQERSLRLSPAGAMSGARCRHCEMPSAPGLRQPGSPACRPPGRGALRAET